MLSALVFYLDQSKIFSSGNGLNFFGMDYNNLFAAVKRIEEAFRVMHQFLNSDRIVLVSKHSAVKISSCKGQLSLDKQNVCTIQFSLTPPNPFPSKPGFYVSAV